MTELSTVEFYGETFALNPDISEFALLEFAEAASDGQDGDTMEGLASLMRLVKECVAEADILEDGEIVGFGRKHFTVTARRNKAGAKELTAVIQAVFTQQTERPTGRPADSSDGPVDTPLRSVSNSDEKASVLPFTGRPDMALGVSRSKSA